MKFNNKIPIIIFSLLLISITGLLYFLLPKSHDVKIINTSRYIQLQYKKSPDFEQKLIDWKIWDKNAIKIVGGTTTHSVSHIIIESTDKISNDFTYRPLKSNKDSSPLANFNYTFNNQTETGTISVYIDPNEINSKTLEGLNFTLAVGIIKTLYENRTDALPEDGFKDIIQNYINEPSSNPFSITIINE